MKREEGSIPLIDYEFIDQSDETQRWYEEMLFFVQISGVSHVLMKKEQICLREGDVLYVQPFHYFCVTNMEGLCLLYRIRVSEAKDSLLIQSVNHFFVNSSIETDKQRFRPLLRLILTSVLELKNSGSEISEKKYIYCLAEELMRNHYKRNDKLPKEQTDGMLQDVLCYIEQNYRQKMTLDDVAGRFYISSSHLARMLKKEWGISFSKYLKEVRLMHAAGELLNHRMPIEQIALNNGFTTARTFSKGFREYYGILPSEYRTHTNRIKVYETKKNEPMEAENKIREMLDGYSEKNESGDIRPLQKKLLREVNVQGGETYDSDHSHRILTIRRAAHLLIPHERKHLIDMIHELGFTQIYFHEFFNDEMELYFLDNRNIPRYNFYKTDQVFDFITEYGITPYIEMSFVPYALAQNVNKRRNNSVSSMPGDIDQWKTLIHNVLNHLIERYGRETVVTWKFCVWNSPDNILMNYSAENRNEFFRLYLESYRIIKDIDARIQVGPATLMNVSVIYPEWMNCFADFYKKYECVPDFLMVNMYMLNTNMEQIKTEKPLMRSCNPRALADGIRIILNNGEKYKWNISDYIVPEWGFDLRTSSPYMGDGIFYAVYIVKNMADCFCQQISFGIANPVDRYPDTAVDHQTFRGRFGLVTYDGIYKSSYYAYKMLNYMGKQFLFKTDGCLITRSEKQIQVLLYNYHHFSEKYAQKKCRTENRKELFDEMYDLEFQIPLSGLSHGYYEQVTMVLNENYGNAYGFWQKYWNVDGADPASVAYLNQVCQPLAKKRYVMPDENGQYILTEHLEPLEVRLILLSRACSEHE